MIVREVRARYRDYMNPSNPLLRPCHAGEIGAMLAIINAAAEAYRGVIPADRWHEPYMGMNELRAELEAGIVFTGCELGGVLVGVMGIQAVRNVDLIRHAYVLPQCQGAGVGSALIVHFRARAKRQVLVGTWAAASWAIGFYERHGFELVPHQMTAPLLRTYWTVSRRQIETSVVLAWPSLSDETATELMLAA